jgi:hypothetical protein
MTLDPSNRRFLMVSGTVFAVVSVVHLLRLINESPVLLGAWAVPMWIS